MDTTIWVNENPPMIRWKDKMSILMVTFVMVGVWLIFIPIVGYFNGKIPLNNLTEMFFSFSILLLGLILVFLGLSSSYTTIYLKNESFEIEKQIGFLKFYKKYSLANDAILKIENEEDEDGIMRYHLVKIENDKKTYILRNLDYTYYKAIQDLIS